MRPAAVLAVLLSAALPAAGDEFRPRAIVSYEDRDLGESSTSSVREELELLMTRLLSDAISVRFKLGARHYDTESVFDTGTVSRMRVMELRPSAMVEMQLGGVAAEAEYSLRSSSYDDQTDEYDRDDEIIRLETEWQEARFLPGGSVRAFRFRLQDDRFDEAVINQSLYALLEKSMGGVVVSGGANLRTDEDRRAGFERTTADTLASVSYSDSWLGGKLAFSGAASGMLTEIEDSSGRRTSRIPTYLPIVRAFWGIDDTPLDSADRPLVSLPTLIDGRFDVLTSVSLGPDAASFQTIAFDLGGLSSVDQIDVVVRDEQRDPVLVAEGVLWDVYTSLDGERWQAHTEELSVVFNRARSQYEISFARVEVRWIKAVSFGVAPQPVFVTEARGLYYTILAIATRDSEYENLSASASITAVPHRLVRLGYTGSGWFVSQQTGVQPPSETRDISHLVSASFDPHPILGLDARLQRRDAITGPWEEEMTAVALGARVAPIRRLQLNFLCEQRENVLSEAHIEGRLCSANAAAQLFPTFDLTLGVSDRVDNYLDSGGTLSTRTYFLGGNARLTRSLRMNLGGTSSRTEIQGQIADSFPRSLDERIYADFDYTAGRALGLGVTVGWVAGEERSGMTQRYRIRWMPFGDGAITLNTSYNQDIDPYSDSISRRLLISPRWEINDFTALILTYSSVTLEGERPFESESYHASLSLFR